MVTSQQCTDRYGAPDVIFERQWMTLWVPPPTIKALPRRIYCHRHLLPLLADAVDRIITAGLEDEIKTWDGCFNVRLKKGGKTPSLHSWGLAFDVNAAWNRFGEQPTMSPQLVTCFTGAGLDWGGIWALPKTDGMHSQIAVLP